MSQPDPDSSWPDPDALGAVTDLYQLTMMAGYHSAGLDRSRATFELFIRRLPPHRSYLVFAGLGPAIADIMRLRFSREQVEVLRHWPVFAEVDPAWFDGLPDYRFRGDIWSVPEGTIVFAGEPIVRVEAALPEAQWIETFLIASLAYPTLVASKAARMVEVARGRALFDFGTRRGHGPLAGLITARSSYLAGFTGTSNVEAAIRLGIPATGTMAHSWVQSFADESAAFAAFARVYPGSTVLVDTYDVARGVRMAAAVEPPIGGVRIDSGDLLTLSKEARRILDESGRLDVKIVGSGDLDERKIDELIRAGAEIDAFGVGTELVTSRDAPALSMVYKLVELDGVGRIKLSPGKKTYPSAKQVWRRRDAWSGRMIADHVTRADEVSDGEPLLAPVVIGGRLARPLPTLKEARERCVEGLETLPGSLRGLEASGEYPLSYSAALEDEADRMGVRQARPS